MNEIEQDSFCSKILEARPSMKQDDCEAQVLDILNFRLFNKINKLRENKVDPDSNTNKTIYQWL